MRDRVTIALVLAGVLMVVAGKSATAETPSGQPRVIRAPEGGLQPHAVVGPGGLVHLVYLSGDLASADVNYAVLEPGRNEFAPSLRVNSGKGSAVALGTIRGAQIALGREGRVHVAWNGTTKATPANPNGGSPML